MNGIPVQDNMGLIPSESIMVGNGLATLEPDSVEGLMRKRGYALLRGYAQSVDEYESLTRRFSKRFRVHGNPNRRWVSADGLTQQVDPGRDYLPPHSEMSYNPHYPDTMWFYCVKPSESGGETTVCDGVAVYEAMEPEVKRLLHAKRLEYRHRYSVDAWTRALGTASPRIAALKLSALAFRYRRRGPFKFSFGTDGTLQMRFQTSAFVRDPEGRWAFANSLEISVLPQYVALRGGGVSLEGEDSVPKEVMESVATITRAHSARTPWNAGDVLMIDNERTMHGRVALPPDQREIYLRIGDRRAVRWM